LSRLAAGHFRSAAGARNLQGVPKEQNRLYDRLDIMIQ